MSESTLITRNEPPEFSELAKFLWSAKLMILGISFIFAIAGVMLALSLPNTYRSSVVLAPTQSLKNASADLGSSLGGLAALAGISPAQNGGFKTEVALAKLQSKEFLYRLFDEQNLIIPLIASKSWDAETNTLTLDEAIIDPKTTQFLELDERAQLWETYKAFSKMLSVEEQRNGMFTISFEHLSPYFAQKILDTLISEINQTMQTYDIKQAEKSIEYLNRKLEQTTIADMQVVFYRLIEEQTKQKMLTEIEDEYIFTTIDPPSFEEEKYAPKRAFIVIILTILGGLFATFIYLVRFYSQRNR
ncbi:LPS O-antigen length regulator [Pseudoalteromonas sp. NC201]|nr:Wzz/FepE/Etk N-terminal domain-containing protein [Pseudoalteromonas sp. B530]AUJ68887.1 LPS O-antigen length regulator [Pseudoalteromonas sp. NC201]MCX2766932.1 Wzz/FepE/Etk N-terminal domain-containing protein [Pseudoalteromonas sp. B530]